MRNVLVFFNNDKVKLVRVEDHLESIPRATAGGLLKVLPLNIRFVTFADGESGACWVAADREITSTEVIDAHRILLLTQNSL